MPIQLFNSQSGDGASLPFYVNAIDPNSNINPWIGVTATAFGETTTIKLQWQDPNGNWNYTDKTTDEWTDNDLKCPLINNAIKYRLILSGSVEGETYDAWAWNCTLAN